MSERYLRGRKGLIFAMFAVLLFCSSCSTFSPQAVLPEPAKISHEEASEAEQIRKGTEAHDRGRYQEAVGIYEKILEKNHDNQTALYEIAFSYNEMGNYDKALEYALKAAEYAVDLSPVYTLIGNIYDVTGKKDKAIEVYKYSLKKYPDNYMLLFNLGIAYAQAHKNDEAKESLKKAMEINPYHSGSHYALATIYSDENSPVPALSAFTMSLILKPESNRSAMTRGKIEDILFGGSVKKTDNTIHITFDSNENNSDEEGDFGSVSMLISLLGAKYMAEENSGADRFEKLSDIYTHIFNMLDELSEKEPKKGFVWKHYVPFFIALNKAGHAKAMVNYAFSNKKADETGTNNFIKWFRTYKWSKK